MSPEKFILNTIENIGDIDFNTVMSFLGMFFIFFWIVVLGWVWVDAGERTTNRTFRIVSVLLVGIFNILGLIIYLIVRPRQTIQEVYWADLERRYLKYETTELGDCKKCGFQLQPGFVSCPSCSEVLKVKCSGCEVNIDKNWRYCPFCNTQNMLLKKEKELSATDMERKVKESSDEAKDAVENKRIRYAHRGGIGVLLAEVVAKAKSVKLPKGNPKKKPVVKRNRKKRAKKDRRSKKK